jgi:colicin import membrane protein
MEMRTASAISTGLHAAVLLFAVVSFSGKSLEATPVESLPIDLISNKEFSEMTKGVKDAPKPVEKPKPPLVEKIAPEVKPVEESKPKVVDNKPEVKATQAKAEPPPPPEPEQKKEVEKKEVKPEPKPPAPVAKDKADPIAEKLKQAKNEKPPVPPKKPPQKHEPKFDVNKIAALIDQREPHRVAAAGAEMNKEASLGYANASAAQISQSEIDAFRRRITECWNPPVGLDSAQDLVVVFRVLFNQDGSIKRGPDFVGGKASAGGPAFAESAKRAILQCQPYTMLRKETYNNWKDMELAFKPSDMFR